MPSVFYPAWEEPGDDRVRRRRSVAVMQRGGKEHQVSPPLSAAVTSVVVLVVVLSVCVRPSALAVARVSARRNTGLHWLITEQEATHTQWG